MKIIEGDLIALAKQGHFEVITHGCNCFCTMGAGIAVPMKQNFKCDVFPMEHPNYKGDINKLGTIDYLPITLVLEKPIKIGNLNLLAPDFGGFVLTVVNSYTQYHYGRNHLDGVYKPVDYEAITLCMRKINNKFKGKSIGLPKIGCGLAGGDWSIVSKIITRELIDMDVTVIELNTKRF
jgi:O-acetyl-ADP-ribose deacetylase (regulator of RNase III)